MFLQSIVAFGGQCSPFVGPWTAGGPSTIVKTRASATALTAEDHHDRHDCLWLYCASRTSSFLATFAHIILYHRDPHRHNHSLIHPRASVPRMRDAYPKTPRQNGTQKTMDATLYATYCQEEPISTAAGVSKGDNGRLFVSFAFCQTVSSRADEETGGLGLFTEIWAEGKGGAFKERKPWRAW